MRAWIFSFITTLCMALGCMDAMAQIRMNGVVSTEKGATVMGALIVVEDSEVVTLSDLTGQYVLKVPDRYAGHRVIVSFAGCQNDTLMLIDGEADVVLKEKETQVVNEIIVSTQKKLQRQADVPIAISVVDAIKQEDIDLEQIDEMSRVIPGFQNMVQACNNAVYGIRGVASDGVESYTQNRISVYQDNVLITRMTASVIEPFDIARVEVVKGPQGTLFGRGALVGALHYVSNRPVDILEGYGKVTYGNYNQRTLEGVVNTPFLNKKVVNRLGLRYDAHDGYIENQAGGTLNGKSVIAIKNSTLFNISDGQTLNMQLNYIRNNDPGVSFKTNKVALPNGEGSTSPYTTAFLNGGKDLCVKRDIFTGILQYDNVINDVFSLSSTSAYRQFSGKELFDADGCYLDLLNGSTNPDGFQISEELRLNWDNGRKLSGFFGTGFNYEDNRHSYKFNGNLNNVFPVVVGGSMRQQLADNGFSQTVADQVAGGIAQFVQAMNPEYVDMVGAILPMLNSSIVKNLDYMLDNVYSANTWAATPDVITESASVVNGTLVELLNMMMASGDGMAALLGGATPEQFVQGLNISQQLSGDPTLNAISNVPLSSDYQENMQDRCKTYEADLFADMTWNFKPRWYLTVGIRGTYEGMRTGYCSSSDVAPILGTSLIYTSSDNQWVWTSKSAASWVGRLVVNWKFDETHNLYASVSRGRRPGVIYFDLDPNEIISLKPESIVNYELGIKGLSKYGHFSYYAAFYYYNWTHFQSSTSYTAEDGTRRYRNDDEGRARAFGFDGSLLYTFNDKLSMFLDYAFCNGRFSSTDTDGNDQELAGKRFRLMPDHTVDLGFNWNRKYQKNTRMVYFHPYFTYTSKIYFTEANDPSLMQKGYALLNANVGYSWKNRTESLIYDVRLWGKNILGHKYLIDAGNAGETIGFPTYVAGTPATVGVTFRVKF